MRLLLDTHAFLWFVFDDPRLSGPAADAISHPAHELVISIASLWEITIKRQLGRLDLGMGLGDFLRRFIDERQVSVLAMHLTHLLVYDELPLRHRDPFDRLLIAQAKTLEVPIVTSDKHFQGYGVDLIW